MSHRTILLLTSIAALSLPLGCGSSVTTAGDAGPRSDVPATDVPVMDVPAVDVPMTGRVPRRPRASAMTCPSVRPPSSCEGGSIPGGTCTADSDCTTGTNGRCVGNSHDGCRCNYDVCTNDSECMAGGPCECRLASRGAAGSEKAIDGAMPLSLVIRNAPGVKLFWRGQAIDLAPHTKGEVARLVLE